MLANDAALQEVVLRSAGIVRALKEGAIHISMNTITVALSEELTEVHRSLGYHFVAAPVFRRPEAAAAAKLYIVAAGAAEPLDRCKPIFDALGQKTFTIGDVPAQANLVKLGGNFMVASARRDARRCGSNRLPTFR